MRLFFFLLGMSLAIFDCQAAPMEHSEIQPDANQTVMPSNPYLSTYSSPPRPMQQVCYDHSCIPCCTKQYKKCKRWNRARKDPRIIRRAKYVDRDLIDTLNTKFYVSEEEQEENQILSATCAKTFGPLLLDKIKPYVVEWSEENPKVASMLRNNYCNYKTATAICGNDEQERKDAIKFMLHCFEYGRFSAEPSNSAFHQFWHSMGPSDYVDSTVAALQDAYNRGGLGAGPSCMN